MSKAATFSERITRASRAFDPAKGQAAAAQIAAEGLAEATSDSPLAAVLTGAAGSSTYLAGLMEKETRWAAEALSGAPETAFTEILAEMRAAEAGEARALDPVLRRAKRRGALLIGLADLGGVWDFEAVTDRISPTRRWRSHRAFISAPSAMRTGCRPRTAGRRMRAMC